MVIALKFVLFLPNSVLGLLITLGECFMSRNQQLNSHVSSTGASLPIQYFVSYCRRHRKGRYLGCFLALR